MAHGLRWGFEAGVDRALLRGARVLTNYPSTKGPARAQVTAAVEKRSFVVRRFGICLLYVWGGHRVTLLENARIGG